MVEVGRGQRRSDAVVNPGGKPAPPRRGPEAIDLAAALQRIGAARSREPEHNLMLLAAHEIERLRAANAQLLALLAEGAELWPIDEDWVYRVRTLQRELAAGGLVAGKGQADGR